MEDGKQGLWVDVQKPYDLTIHSKETSTRKRTDKIEIKSLLLDR